MRLATFADFPKQNHHYVAPIVRLKGIDRASGEWRKVAAKEYPTRLSVNLARAMTDQFLQHCLAHHCPDIIFPLRTSKLSCHPLTLM